ncbi:MAG: hypothetical protein GH155_03960 [Spirochaeta sp.]|nr:hypothetical protein [Spirochaeta sp.]
MVDPDLALEMVRNIQHRPFQEEVSLAAALGRVLAQEIHSTIDSPPLQQGSHGRLCCKKGG